MCVLICMCTATTVPLGSFLASEIKAVLYQELRRAWWTRLTFCRHPGLLFPRQLGMLRQPLSAEPLHPALFFMPFSSLSPLQCRCIVYEVCDSADGGLLLPSRTQRPQRWLPAMHIQSVPAVSGKAPHQSPHLSCLFPLFGLWCLLLLPSGRWIIDSWAWV